MAGVIKMILRQVLLTVLCMVVVSTSSVPETHLPYFCLDRLEKVKQKPRYLNFILKECRDFPYPNNSWTHFFTFAIGSPLDEIEVTILNEMPQARGEILRFMEHLKNFLRCQYILWKQEIIIEDILSLSDWNEVKISVSSQI